LNGELGEGQERIKEEAMRAETPSRGENEVLGDGHTTHEMKRAPPRVKAPAEVRGMLRKREPIMIAIAIAVLRPVYKANRS
jgi:hypothetical protein